MRKAVFFCLILLVLFGCKNRLPEDVQPDKPQRTVSENIFNLSGLREVSRFEREKLFTTDVSVVKNYNFATNYSQQFLNLFFPFSFYVHKIFVKKGDRVVKGTVLVEMSSDELNNVLAEYKKTQDATLANKIKDAGISPDTQTPISILRIVSPVDGFVTEILVKEQTDFQPQKIAVIQRGTTLTLEGTLAAADVTEDTNFFVNLGNDTELPANVIEKNVFGTFVKIKLTAELPFTDTTSGKISVKTVQTLSNVFLLKKQSVLEDGNHFFVFIDKGEGIVEKREVKGYYYKDSFVANEGVFENETVFTEGVPFLAKYSR